MDGQDEILRKVVSEGEILQIPQDIRKKIETYIRKNIEEKNSLLTDDICVEYEEKTTRLKSALEELNERNFRFIVELSRAEEVLRKHKTRSNRLREFELRLDFNQSNQLNDKICAVKYHFEEIFQRLEIACENVLLNDTGRQEGDKMNEVLEIFDQIQNEIDKFLKQMAPTRNDA